MSDAVDELALYLHLARASQRRNRPLISDRLLVLAAVRAERLGLPRVYQLCRQRILQRNPAHLLQDYAELPAPGNDERLEALLTQLERKFPREKAEHMLRSLGIQMAGERATYRDAEEYAFALLDTSPGECCEISPNPFAPPTFAEPSPSAQPVRSRPWWRFGQPTPWGNLLITCFLPAVLILIAFWFALLLPLLARFWS